MTFSDWAQRQIASRPVEATIVRKIYRATREAGHPITYVNWGEGDHPVSNVTGLLEYAFNVDTIVLNTDSGSWVLLVMGEGYDLIADYTTDLDTAVDPIIDWAIASDK